MLDMIVNVGAALLAGFGMKRAGQSKRTGSLPVHKTGSPVAAVCGAAAAEALRHILTGDPVNTEAILLAGTAGGAVASGVQSWTKNGAELAALVYANYMKRKRERR